MAYVPDDLEIELAKDADPELQRLWQEYQVARESLLSDLNESFRKQGIRYVAEDEDSLLLYAKTKERYDDAHDRLVKYCKSRGLNDLTSLHL